MRIISLPNGCTFSHKKLNEISAAEQKLENKIKHLNFNRSETMTVILDKNSIANLHIPIINPIKFHHDHTSRSIEKWQTKCQQNQKKKKKQTDWDVIDKKKKQNKHNISPPPPLCLGDIYKYLEQILLVLKLCHVVCERETEKPPK